MIEAVFIKKKYVWNCMILFCGLFIIGLFVFLGFKDPETSANKMLFGVASGAIICIISVTFMFANHNAYLKIENGHIKGKFNYFGKLDCLISDVAFAMSNMSTLTIQLKSGKLHTIYGIKNSYELCSAIRRDMTFETNDPPERLIDSMNELKSGRKKSIIYVYSGIALMFVVLFVTVFLTGEREMESFTQNDWTIFVIMCIIEAALLFVLFYFALKTASFIVPIRRVKYAVQRSIIETAPPLPGNVLKVFVDGNYIQRVTLFGFPKSENVYYTVEELSPGYSLNKIYESQIFEDFEQISDEFDDLLDITEKVL